MTGKGLNVTALNELPERHGLFHRFHRFTSQLNVSGMVYFIDLPVS